MSKFADIFAALIGMDVELNGAPVRTFDLNAVPNRLASADLPARLLIPTKADNRSVRPVTLRRVLSAEHAITDLFLLRPAQQGTGLADAGPALAAYKGQYLAALQQIVLPKLCTLEAVQRVDFGVFAVANVEFVGAEFVLIIREIIP